MSMEMIIAVSVMAVVFIIVSWIMQKNKSNIAAAVLFGVLAWQSQLYARDLLETGDVSLTLGMPTWPFVLGLPQGPECYHLFFSWMHYGS